MSGIPTDSGGKELLGKGGGLSLRTEGRGAELPTGIRGGNCTVSREPGKAEEDPNEATPGNKMESIQITWYRKLFLEYDL